MNSGSSNAQVGEMSSTRRSSENVGNEENVDLMDCISSSEEILPSQPRPSPPRPSRPPPSSPDHFQNIRMYAEGYNSDVSMPSDDEEIVRLVNNNEGEYSQSSESGYTSLTEAFDAGMGFR